uniref:DUF834 domain-containing protein n=1 Tax=Oryza punctata TaxID=4537 RepID=A0A0E0M6Z2_ORYPU
MVFIADFIMLVTCHHVLLGRIDVKERLGGAGVLLAAGQDRGTNRWLPQEEMVPGLDVIRMLLSCRTFLA